NACREWSAGRRGLLARALAPRDPHRPQATLGPGSSARRPADRKAGLWEPIARLPAPPGAPFPSFEGKKEKGTKGPTRGPKNKHTGQRSVGCLTIASEMNGRVPGSPPAKPGAADRRCVRDRILLEHLAERAARQIARLGAEPVDDGAVFRRSD